eukprot:gene12800-15021_t
MEETKNIKTGDLVTFFSEQEEEEGYFSKVHDSAVLNPNKSKECVFKIHPMTQYTARKALKKKAKRMTQRAAEQDAERDPELKQLEEYQDIEDVTNETTLIQLEGRDLIYGQIVQLFHPKSGQFLFAKHYNADHSIVGFRADGNQKCYFKIAPRSQAHMDGAKVSQDDLVLLRHEKTGLFLRESNFFNEKGFFEIGLSESGTFWRMALSDVEGKLGLNVVKSGEPFRLFHREGGFVKTGGEDCRTSTTFTYSTKTPSSIRSIFEIEVDSKPAGPASPLMFASTTSLLAHQQTYSDIAFGVNSTTDDLATQATELYKDAPLSLVSEADKYSPHSTFCFVSKEANSTSETVTYGSFVRIQSLSKHWLHFISDETFHHNGDLVGTKKYFKFDDFQIKQIPKSQMEDYSFVVVRMNKIQQFMYATEMRKKITLQELRIILVELIKFSSQSDVEDPLEREGAPIKTHQNLLASPQNIAVLLELLQRFFAPQLDPLSISYIFRIFKQMAKGNIKNGITINRHIKTIAGPVELREKVVSFGFGSILLEIYKGNNILLESVTEDTVLSFIADIELTRDPKYMELLGELCVCGGRPIVKNQQYLCDLLLEKRPGLLLHTRVSQQVEIEVSPGRWMAMAEFMSRGDEKTQHYFEQSLALYAAVARGRNYNGIRLSGQFASYKECFVCLKDETLPYGLRGIYTNLVLHVFMDCYPQKAYAKINYVWNPLNSDEPPISLSLGRNKGVSSSEQLRAGGAISTGNSGTIGVSGVSAVQADDDIFSTFCHAEPIHITDPSNISQFLMNYVLRPENFTWNSMYSSNITLQRPQWGFFHKILIAVKYAFKFGFFKRKERLLLNRLKDILELQSVDTTKHSQMDLGRTMGGSRLLEDDSSILVAIKVEILHILHIMLSLQKKTVLETFLYEMSKNDQIQAASATAPPDDNTETNVKRLLVTKLDATVTHKQPMTQKNDFVNNMFGLLKHENNQLTSLVLSLLSRVYKYQNFYAQLYNPVQKLMILPHAGQHHTYQQALKRMEEMTKCCSNPLTTMDTDDVMRNLAYFIHLCTSPDKAIKHQTMLRVMGMHKRIFGVLKMGCSLDELFDERGEVYLALNTAHLGGSSGVPATADTTASRTHQSCFVAKIFRSCYEFLRVFCRGNPTNQALLYHHTEFLIGHLIRYGNIFGTVETLMEIFKDNITLCVAFGESPYLKLLVEFAIHAEAKDVDPVFLRLLTMIMIPGGTAVIEIQVAISNLLKEYSATISKWFLPLSTVKGVMREPKGSILSKFHTSNTSSTYRLQAALHECLQYSLAGDGALQDGAAISASIKSAPKLIRSTAKHMLVTVEEVLPREFVVNLSLIWLLTSCSHGRNVPTEIICRDFISMADCFDVLVVRSDGAGRDASSLMIHDTKEYLEHNLQFRFKSAYVAFLHEVYFNSDTLKGDLLALQLNESLWNLFDQFTNQLRFLFTSHATARMSADYFLMMTRSIVLPMLSILERFYSQCFYFDKATQKHLLYSGLLMACLLQLYSVDESLPIPMAPKRDLNASFADKDASTGGIHPILLQLDLDEKIALLTSLVKCLKAMDRSAISPSTPSPSVSVASVSEVIKGCEEIIIRLDHQNSKWSRQRTDTFDAAPTAPALVTKSSSTMLLDRREHPMARLVRERGYQQLALMVLDKDTAALSLMASDSPTSPTTSIGTTGYQSRDLRSSSTEANKNASTFLEILVFQLRNTLFDNNQLKLHSLRILFSVLEHHPAKKREMQIQLTEMYCHSAAIGLLGSKCHDIAFEALTLLLALLEEHSTDPANPKPNEYVKEAVKAYFTSSPDIEFFCHIFHMMERAKLNLRDTKRNMRLESFKGNLGGNLTLNNRSTTIADLVGGTSSTDINPYSTEFLMMSNIFRVLQLLCQGSSNLFKHYMRCQPDNYKSYDLLKEMCQFLKILETIVDIDAESIQLAARFFSCMREIVKHTPDNQIAVTNVQLCRAICNILKKRVTGARQERYLDLKIEVVDFLLHVVDREDPRVVAKMIDELDYTVIEENTKIFAVKSNYDLNEKVIKLASMSFRLIKILADNDKSENRQLADCLLACGEHCRSRIGRVEMLHNTKLERIYFAIPSYSRRLILEEKEQSKIRSDENELQDNLEEYFMSNKVNWSKSSEKLEHFMDWSEKKLIELEHRHQLKSKALAYFIVSHINKWQLLNFLIACVINVLLIVFSKTEAKDFDQDFGTIYFNTIIYPLGILQLVFTTLTTVSYFTRYGSVLILQGWIKYLGQEKSFMLRTNHERMHNIRQIFTLHKFLFINCLHIANDVKSLFYIFSMLFSILGMAVSPFFFSFHIFQITLKTKALRVVLRAISLNKGTLLLMGVFILQTTYLLSIFSFVFFTDRYVTEENGDLHCSTLLQCLITNVFYGVPTSGQIVQFVSLQNFTANSNTDTGKAVLWTLFCLVFYVVISIILLNVILGVIVDTFGQLRDQRSDTEDYKTNFCFICSIDRETFQKKGIDFNKHVEDDHNKWYYLYFFAYLKERVQNMQQNQFSDSELNALKMIENKQSLSLFPIDMAMSLQGEYQSKESTRMMQAIKDMDQKINSSQLNTTISMMLEEIKLLRQQVNEMKK